jgi:hypothetical protein
MQAGEVPKDFAKKAVARCGAKKNAGEPAVEQENLEVL